METATQYSNWTLTTSVNVTDNETSTETLSELNYRYATALLPFSIFLGFLGFVGIIGNVLVFAVYGFGRKFKDKKYRYYVLCLAAIDLITCLTLIPAEIVKHRSYFNFVETQLCKTKCFFNVFAASAASFCLLIVAIDRYFLTCHPLLTIRALSHDAALRLCIGMIALGALSAIPAAILCGTSKLHVENRYGNLTEVFLCSVAKEYEVGLFRYIYRYSLVIIQSIISIIVIVLYAQIGYVVVKVMKTRLQMTDRSRFHLDTFSPVSQTYACSSGRHGVTRPAPPLPTNIKLLFIVTVVFLVTFFLYIGLSFVDITHLTPIQFLGFSVFFRFYFVHSVINPILYAKMDSLFRKRCIRLFRRRRW